MSLSPEREAYYKTKRQKVLKKDQSLSYHYAMQAVDFEAYKGMRLLDIEFACALWPFGPTPDPKKWVKAPENLPLTDLFMRLHLAILRMRQTGWKWAQMSIIKIVRVIHLF